MFYSYFLKKEHAYFATRLTIQIESPNYSQFFKSSNECIEFLIEGERLERKEELQINKPYPTADNILINSILNSQRNKRKNYRANSTTFAVNNSNCNKPISEFSYKEQ